MKPCSSMIFSCLMVVGALDVGVLHAQNGNPRAGLQPKALITLVDTGWQTNTQISDCVTGNGDDSWQLTLTRAREVGVHVADLNCPGDYYQLYLDGKLLGTTPNLAPPWGCVTGGTNGPNSAGTFRVTLGPGTYLFTVRDAGFDGHTQQEIADEKMCPAGFVVSAHLSSPTFRIAAPAAGQGFPLSQQDGTATSPVGFSASGASATVSWTATLEYETSGMRGSKKGVPYRLPRTFRTDADQTHDETYVAQGGRVTVNASAVLSGQEMKATPVVFAVTGTRLDPAEITSRLTGLYEGGATPDLMTGIAECESSYKQFARRVLYGRGDLWPNESGDGGSHIGLMMMPTAGGIGYAWDWHANTAGGVSLFKQKLAAAGRNMTRIIQQHKGLRTLSPVELENMALLLYGPDASGDLDEQYYAPVLSGGAWTWQQNTDGNAGGVAYADHCRAQAQ